MMFGWYSTTGGATDGANGGRVKDRSPALIRLPKPFRYAIIGLTHNEYDLASAHLGIYVSCFDKREAPAAWGIYDWLTSANGKAATMDAFPAAKEAVHRALNVARPYQHDGPLRWWLRTQGGEPGWLLEFFYEVQHLRRIALERLQARGWHGDRDRVTSANELWHAMAHGEAAVVRLTLHYLRQQRAIFSHGIVHDAIFVHREVAAEDVQTAFTRSTHQLGLAHLKLVPKTWDTTITKYEQRLQESSYSSNAKIDLTGIAGLQKAANQQHASRTTSGQGNAPRSIWDTQGVLPKTRE